MSGFFSDLFGGASGKRAANAAADEQIARINSGYNSARATAGAGYDSADATLAGYEQAYGGTKGAALYGDSLGVNGAEGGQRAQSAYEAGRNPYLQYEQDQASKALARQNNAGGMRWSGVNAAATAKARMGLGYQDNQNWQNRLMQYGQQGAQFGQQRAGNAIQRGNQFAEYDIGQNTGIANANTQRQQGIYQAQQQGYNNLLGAAGSVGGMAIKGFAPGAGGGTAFGNMASGVNRLFA